jgi:hypothetical protein
VYPARTYTFTGITWGSASSTSGLASGNWTAGTSSAGWSASVFRGTACPANSTLSGGQCTCAATFQENATHTACVPKTSQAEEFCGTMTGYTRKLQGQGAGSVPESVCMLIDPPFPDGGPTGCLMSVGMSVRFGDVWGGVGKYGGGACTPATDPLMGEPRKAEEDNCANGFKGVVNGVTKCVPAEPDKGATGIKVEERVNPDGSKDVTKETTVCNGANCTTTKEVTTTGATGTVTVSTSSTSQSMDDKCRLDPTNPVCTKTGTTSGTGTGTEEGGDCGGEGEVACKVKVDETGTPTDGEARFQEARDKLDEVKGKYDELRDKAAGSQDKGMFEQFRSMFLVPPIAACEPIVLPEQVASKKIDPCAVVDGVRSVMAYIWALGGLFLCFFMIKRSFE